MKLIKNILLLTAVALFASCKTDVDTPQFPTPDEFVAPVINACSDVIVNANNSAAESVIFTWKAADFGLPVQIVYSVYLASGETSGLLGTSSSTSLTIMKGDLNGVALNKLGIEPNGTGAVTAYVTASVYGTTQYDELKSAASNSFNVTTYLMPLKNFYVVGFFNGWSPDTAPEIWETAGGTGTFEGMYPFPEDGTNPGGSGFKIIEQRNWGAGNWGFDAFTGKGDNFTSSSDGNLVLPAGIYQLSMTRTPMTISATAVQRVAAIGTFNEWADDDSELTYNAVTNVWESVPVTFGEGGEYLIRLNKSWDFKYGSSGKASTTIDGGIELVTKGGDNIPVAEAGTYIITLHADRTPYVVELVKQ
ncbi:MAG: SusE domain-containing protein [Prevotellaceae bacterium]|jgi:hypothetical protein|nr:SusE domain-containing protein [Prevotellaceae bacterium]